jgi:hypothetical protein
VRRGAGTCTHDATPRDGCFLPLVKGKAQLKLKRGAAGKPDQLAWTWAAGDSAGRGRSGIRRWATTSCLCIYDAGGLAVDAWIPGINAFPYCGTPGTSKPCWKYKQKPGGSESYTFVIGGYFGGHRKLQFKDSVIPGKARMKYQAKDDLTVAALVRLLRPPAWTSPVTVRMVSPANHCWSATFSTPLRNDQLRYQAKGG